MKQKDAAWMTDAFVSLALLCCSGLPVFSQGEAPPAMSADQIVAKASDMAYYQANDGRARVSMRIKDAQGRTRSREFTILRRNVDARGDDTDPILGDQKFYVYFRRPADVNKMVFMVWKHRDRDDDRWMYLPALDLVKRIAASDERTSFVGSDFFYEDVSGRSVREDRHELVETTEHYFVVDNTPLNPSLVEFSRFTAWIHRKTYLPVKMEYRDRNGEVYRVYEALKVETIDGHPTVVQSRMRNTQTGSETMLEYHGVKYDQGLPDDIFTERYLRKAPRKYLK